MCDGLLTPACHVGFKVTQSATAIRRISWDLCPKFFYFVHSCYYYAIDLTIVEVGVPRSQRQMEKLGFRLDTISTCK